MYAGNIRNKDLYTVYIYIYIHIYCINYGLRYIILTIYSKA